MCLKREEIRKGKLKENEKELAGESLPPPTPSLALHEIERKCMIINCKICVSRETKQAGAEARMKALSLAGRHRMLLRLLANIDLCQGEKKLSHSFLESQSIYLEPCTCSKAAEGRFKRVTFKPCQRLICVCLPVHGCQQVWNMR